MKRVNTVEELRRAVKANAVCGMITELRLDPDIGGALADALGVLDEARVLLGYREDIRRNAAEAMRIVDVARISAKVQRTRWSRSVDQVLWIWIAFAIAASVNDLLRPLAVALLGALR